MAAYSIVYMPTAKEDIQETLEYYDTHIPGQSERFLQALYDAEASLASTPQVYGFLEQEPLLRFKKLEKLRFIIIFEIVDDLVYIYSVRHTSRDSFI